MKILFNLSHPAHVHLFKNAIHSLKLKGHEITVAARKKEFAIQLLNADQIDHVVLTTKGRGMIGLLKELIIQQFKLSKIIRDRQIELMVQMNGIFNAPVGKFYQIPTLAFSDTENDIWANRIAFSLSKHIFLPTCFDHSFGGHWQNEIHYPGYHELAYLSPRYIKEAIKPKAKFLLRFVGWAAGHDIGETGLSNAQKIELVNILRPCGTVHISSEAPLPKEIEMFAYKIHPAQMHDFMIDCKMIIGESATMASEAACLGIPAIFISNTGRGYTTEEDQKYDLIKHFRLNQWNTITKTIKDWVQQDLAEQWQKKRRNMLKDKIEVTDWMVDLIDQYPHSIQESQQGNFKGYAIQCVE